MLLGAHLSIAGGMHKALDKARRYGFDCVGLFVRNQVRWKSPRLNDEAVSLFRSTRRRSGIGPVVAHASYLVNLAGRAGVRRRSVAAMLADMERCDRLGIEYLVVHPGARERADDGIALIAGALNRIVEAHRIRRPRGVTRILLETTAGQGNSIGHTFEQLARILALLGRPRRFGVCLDTCHIFAAGYDIRTRAAYRVTMADFERSIGLSKLLAVHLNDSLRPLGSRVDRHAHIGRGRIGLEGFANIVNDRRLSGIPMILETPKGTDRAGRDWDVLNAEALRRLERPQRRPAGPRPGDK